MHPSPARTVRDALLATALALTLLLPAACGRKDDAADGAATPTPATAVTPTLQVLAPRVEFRATESDALEELPEGGARDVAPGANVLVGESGHARLAWDGFLANDLLSGTDILLSLSLPQDRRAILDQAAGTARYVLEGAGEPASLEIIAGWIALLVEQGEADIVVSFIPGEEPTAWVAVLEGAAQVTRGEDSVRLESGEVAAFTETGDMPAPQTADPTRISAWIDQVARGTATGSIAAVGLRCEVGDAGATLREDPSSDAEALGDALAGGTLVEVLGRDEDGSWLRVRSLLGSEEGWTAAADLSCNAPAASAPLADELASGEPTATLAPLPTRALVAPVAPLGSPSPVLTPTPTATLAADASISFSADKKELRSGECATLRWEVSNIRAVYLDGQGVVGSGSKRVCPTSTTTYVLRVELQSGGTAERSVEIKVTAGATRTPTAGATRTAPPATATTQPTQPFPTPTLAPTSPPPTPTVPAPTATNEPPTPEPPTPEPPTPEPPTPEPPTPGW